MTLKIFRTVLARRLWLFPVFITLLYFFTRLTTRGIDPDIGWHLRIAKDALEAGIFPSFDRYSFSLNNFPWVVFEFRFEEVMYLIFRTGGYVLLQLTFSTVTALLLLAHTFLTVKIFKVRPVIAAFTTGILALGLISTFGVRTPVFATWANIILFWLVYAYLNNRLRPIICYLLFAVCFLVWSNAHPSFLIGLGILVLAVAFRSWSKRQVDLQGVVIFISSAMITFLNPYGPRLWLEIIGHFLPASSFMHNYIQEWLPIWRVFPIDFLGLVVLFTALIFLWDGRKVLLNQQHSFFFFITIFYLAATVLAIRNLPLFIIWATPLVAISLDKMVKLRIQVPTFYKLLFSTFLTFNVLALLFSLILTLPTTLPINRSYPSQIAVDQTKTLAASKRLFNPYGWGGLLIWNFGGSPKIFIDGRMPATWYQDDVFPFKDYVLASQGSDQIKGALFDKYKFSVALVEKHSWTKLDALNQFLIGGEKVETVMAKSAEDRSVRLWLSNNSNWTRVFSDDTAEVFIRKNSP